MKKTLFILITILTLAIILFVLAEITARIIWNGLPPVPQQKSTYPYYPDNDPDISYVLLPEFAYENGFILTNKEGFRIERNLSKQKSPDTYRIVFIGDSLVLGTRTKINKTICRLLQNGFDTLKYSGGKKIEVLNFGIPGHNFRQYAAVLKKYAMKYHPDAIYLGISVFNDLDGLFIEYLGNGYLTRRNVNESNGVNYSCKPPGWLQWNSYALRFLYYRKTESREGNKNTDDVKIQGEVRRYLPASCSPDDSVWDAVKEKLKEILKTAKDNKADLKVFIFPTTAQIAYPDLSRKPQEILTGICKTLGIQYNDFYEEFLFYKQKTGKLPFRDASSHPDDWMYNYIAFSLRDEFAFDNLGRPENDYGAVIDLGDKGDVKYLSYGWADREKLGNTGFRWMSSAKARLVFNNFKKEVKSLSISCFPFDQCKSQTLTISLNSIELGTINIDKNGQLTEYKLTLKEPMPLQNFNMLDITPGCVKPAPGDAESMIITPRMISVAVDKIILN